MSWEHLLGLPLEDAIDRLRAGGVEPTILQTRAPRRLEGVGALRVVRIQDDGRTITASGFLTELKEQG